MVQLLTPKPEFSSRGLYVIILKFHAEKESNIRGHVTKSALKGVSNSFQVVVTAFWTFFGEQIADSVCIRAWLGRKQRFRPFVGGGREG